MELRLWIRRDKYIGEIQKRLLGWLLRRSRHLAILHFLLGGILKRPFRLAPHCLGIFVWFGLIGDHAILHLSLGAIQKGLLGWLPTRYYLRLSMVNSTLLVQMIMMVTLRSSATNLELSLRRNMYMLRIEHRIHYDRTINVPRKFVPAFWSMTYW